MIGRSVQDTGSGRICQFDGETEGRLALLEGSRKFMYLRKVTAIGDSQLASLALSLNYMSQGLIARCWKSIRYSHLKEISWFEGFNATWNLIV